MGSAAAAGAPSWEALVTGAPTESQPGDPSTGDEPEHRNDRRRFLIWSCMLGVVRPERVTERIVAELEREAAGQ